MNRFLTWPGIAAATALAAGLALAIGGFLSRTESIFAAPAPAVTDGGRSAVTRPSLSVTAFDRSIHAGPL